ncbi:hypothetical protein D3C73_740630 [compost metagenome]
MIETFLLEIQIQPDQLKLRSNGHLGELRILKYDTAQSGEFLNQLAGLYCIIFDYIGLNRIQNIENKMWIHLRTNSFQFTFI